MEHPAAFLPFRAAASVGRRLAVLVIGLVVVQALVSAGDLGAAPRGPAAVRQQSAKPVPRAPIFDAAKTGDTATVANLLDKGVPVDTLDEATGATPLIIAVLAGHAEVTKLLLMRKANANAQTKDGLSALWVAASAGREDLVRLLLDGGADPNQKSPYGSPEAAALSKGHLAVVAALQKRGSAGSNIKVTMSTSPVEATGTDPSRIAPEYMLVVLFALNPRPSSAFAGMARPVIEKHALSGARRASELSPVGFEMVLVGLGDVAVRFGASWADPLAQVLSTRGDFPDMAFRNGGAQPTERDGQLVIEFQPGTEMKSGARVWRYSGGAWIAQCP